VIRVPVRMKHEGKVIRPPNLKQKPPKKRVKKRRYYLALIFIFFKTIIHNVNHMCCWNRCVYKYILHDE
jgi:hypothetical protein